MKGCVGFKIFIAGGFGGQHIRVTLRVVFVSGYHMSGTAIYVTLISGFTVIYKILKCTGS
ncbi:MAG TPA: hypothetical protein DIV41_04555 [Ruminococcaceae bacterium]|nr:hypothetical protein [Oscillospiraceae bacterium]